MNSNTNRKRKLENNKNHKHNNNTDNNVDEKPIEPTDNDDSFIRCEGLLFEKAVSNHFTTYDATILSIKYSWLESLSNYVYVPCPYKHCQSKQKTSFLQFNGIIQRKRNEFRGPYLEFTCFECKLHVHIKVDTTIINEAFKNVDEIAITPLKSTTTAGKQIDFTPESKSLLVASHITNKRLYEKKEHESMLSPKAKKRLQFNNQKNAHLNNQKSYSTACLEFGEQLIFSGTTNPIYEIVRTYNHGLPCYKTIWQNMEKASKSHQDSLKNIEFQYKIIIRDNGQVVQRVTNPTRDDGNKFIKVVENILMLPDIHNLHPVDLPQNIDEVFIDTLSDSCMFLKLKIFGNMLFNLSGQGVNKAHYKLPESILDHNCDFKTLPKAWKTTPKIFSIPLTMGSQSDISTTADSFGQYKEYVKENEILILVEDQAGVMWTNSHVNIRRHDMFETFKHKKSLAPLHLHMNSVKAVVTLYKTFLLSIAQKYGWSSIVSAIKSDIVITNDYEKIWDFLEWVADVLISMLIEKYKRDQKKPLTNIQEFIEFFQNKNTTVTNFIFREYFILKLLKIAIRRNRGDLIIMCLRMLVPIFDVAKSSNYFNYSIDILKTFAEYEDNLKKVILNNLCVALSGDENHCVSLDFLIEMKNNKIKQASKTLKVGTKKLDILSSHPNFLKTKNVHRRISKRHTTTANTFIKQNNIEELLKNTSCCFKVFNKSMFQKACIRWNQNTLVPN